MPLRNQFEDLVAALPDDWTSADIWMRVDRGREAMAPVISMINGYAQPGGFVFTVSHSTPGIVVPDVENVLRRLDQSTTHVDAEMSVRNVRTVHSETLRRWAQSQRAERAKAGKIDSAPVPD